RVSTSGPQRYASFNGTTLVTDNLTAPAYPITFLSPVVVNDGVTVTAGASAVSFVGSGTQTLQSGSGVAFGNLNHTTIGTLLLAGALSVQDSFINGAGTFDANDQAVTIDKRSAVLSGTYLAGTAPQTFRNGLDIAS